MSSTSSDVETPPPIVFWVRRRDQVTVVVLSIVWLGWIAFIWSFDNLTDEPSIVHHAVSYRIDINAANWIEISQLKGIGPVLAKRIVESRDADGPFLSVEDVQRVRGIGPKKLEANRDWIRVNHISSD